MRACANYSKLGNAVNQKAHNTLDLIILLVKNRIYMLEFIIDRNFLLKIGRLYSDFQ